MVHCVGPALLPQEEVYEHIPHPPAQWPDAGSAPENFLGLPQFSVSDRSFVEGYGDFATLGAAGEGFRQRLEGRLCCLGSLLT
jgi:hypothetical protein